MDKKKGRKRMKRLWSWNGFSHSSLPRTKGVFSFLLIVIVVSALTSALIRPVFANDPFQDYVIGGSGKWQCMPKYEFPMCPPKEEKLKKIGEAVAGVCSECVKMINSYTELQKAMLILSLLALPTGIEFAASAWSDVPFDVLTCVTIGLNKLSLEHPEKKEAFDDLVRKINTIRSIVTDTISAGTEFESHKKDTGKLKAFYEKVMFSKDPTTAASKLWDAWELGWHAGEFKEVRETLDSLEKVFVTPVEQAAGHIKEANRLISNCEFESASQELNKVEEPLRKFCEWEGYYYRNLEKRLECYYEWHTKAIHFGNTPQARDFYEEQRFLGVKRDYIIRNLNRFKDIEKSKEVIEKGKRFLADYYTIVGKGNEAISKKDSLKACDSIAELQSIREKAPKNYLSCFDATKTPPDLDIEVLRDRARWLQAEKVEEVKGTLKYTEEAINSCRIAEARDGLRRAEEKVTQLVSLLRKKCFPELERDIIGVSLELSRLTAAAKSVAYYTFFYNDGRYCWFTIGDKCQADQLKRKYGWLMVADGPFDSEEKAEEACQKKAQTAKHMGQGAYIIEVGGRRCYVAGKCLKQKLPAVASLPKERVDDLKPKENEWFVYVNVVDGSGKGISSASVYSHALGGSQSKNLGGGRFRLGPFWKTSPMDTRSIDIRAEVMHRSPQSFAYMPRYKNISALLADKSTVEVTIQFTEEGDFMKEEQPPVVKESSMEREEAEEKPPEFIRRSIPKTTMGKSTAGTTLPAPPAVRQEERPPEASTQPPATVKRSRMDCIYQFCPMCKGTMLLGTPAQGSDCDRCIKANQTNIDRCVNQ